MSIDLIISPLLKRLAMEAQELPEIISPVLSRNGIIRVQINQHPYSLQTNAESVGWCILKPTSSHTAKVIRAAEVYEIQAIQEKMPRLRVIAMRRIHASRWLVYPWNLSDAESKNLKIPPYDCLMVDTNIEPFMVLQTRLWNNQLIFESVIPSIINIDLLGSLDEGIKDSPAISGMIPEFKTVYSMLTDEIEQARKATVAGRIDDAVSYLGGDLIGFSESGNGYTIRWKVGENEYSTIVQSDLRLISSGICLSGRDRDQTLTSIVSVMRQRDQRYDNDNYYDEDE
jgi:hypothetical protein